MVSKVMIVVVMMLILRVETTECCVHHKILGSLHMFG